MNKKFVTSIALNPETYQALEKLATHYNVSRSIIVRYLINEMMKQFETNNLKIDGFNGLAGDGR